MNELIVKLDFNVDEIFDEAFRIDLNCMIREAVLAEFRLQVRETTIKIYKEQELDVSEAVLKQYKQEHADFEASMKEK